MSIYPISIEIFQMPQLVFPFKQYLILLCHVCYTIIRRFQFFDTVQQCVKFCEVLGLWIANPYCQHGTDILLLTVLEGVYLLNIPWKQVNYNTHNAYQALSRVLHRYIHEFVACVTRVN